MGEGAGYRCMCVAPEGEGEAELVAEGATVAGAQAPRKTLRRARRAEEEVWAADRLVVAPRVLRDLAAIAWAVPDINAPEERHRECDAQAVGGDVRPCQPSHAGTGSAPSKCLLVRWSCRRWPRGGAGNARSERGICVDSRR